MAHGIGFSARGMLLSSLLDVSLGVRCDVRRATIRRIQAGVRWGVHQSGLNAPPRISSLESKVKIGSSRIKLGSVGSGQLANREHDHRPSSSRSERERSHNEEGIRGYLNIAPERTRSDFFAS